ncbi:MAG: hypothetical protein AB7D92_05070 [Sphaerochaeta sp.]
MKPLVLLFLLLVPSLTLSASILGLQVDLVHPNQIHVSWQEVQGAEYYDLYLNKKPMVHTHDCSAVLGSNERPLSSHTDYEVLIAARKKGVGELAVERIQVQTTGWEGHYRWVNQSEDDNKGKCSQLDFLVTWDGISYEIAGLFDQPYRLYPLLRASLVGEQIPWEGDAPYQVAYRLNAEQFNTTNFTPRSWRVTRMEAQDTWMEIVVETKVGMMKFTTTSIYRFTLSGKGERQLHFQTKGTGIASWGLFSCPHPGDDGVFKCTALDEEVL